MSSLGQKLIKAAHEGIEIVRNNNKQQGKNMTNVSSVSGQMAEAQAVIAGLPPTDAFDIPEFLKRAADAAPADGEVEAFVQTDEEVGEPDATVIN